MLKVYSYVLEKAGRQNAFYTYSRARLRVSRFLVGTTIQLSNAEKKELL